MQENNKPTKVYKAGLLNLSLWENEGKEGTIKSFTFQRSYQDTEGKWNHTQSIKTTDIPKLIAVLNKAYSDMVLIE